MSSLFWKQFDRCRPIWPHLEELTRRSVFTWGPPGEVPGDREVRISGEGLSPEARGLVAYASQTAASTLDLWLLAMTLEQGPKIFTPTLGQCLALEQIETRLSVSDYAQPYLIMIVEYPESWARRYPSQGTDEYEKPVTQIPLYTTVAWWPGESVIASVAFSSKKSVAGAFHEQAGKVLDDWSRGSDYSTLYPDNGSELSRDESQVSTACRRIALNSMLLLMEQGCRRIGPDNPHYAARLQRYLEKARKRRDGVGVADRNLRAVPVRYDLERTIDLSVTERIATPASDSATTGRTVSPHWRRGHWRMQAHGPAMTLRKRILIRPVLIHKDQLTEEKLTGGVNYRLKE